MTPGDADLSGGRPYVLDPLESMPAKWRDTTPGKGAPWEVGESMEEQQCRRLMPIPAISHAEQRRTAVSGQAS